MLMRGTSTPPAEPSGETPQSWRVASAAMIGVAVGPSPLPFYTIGMVAPELSHAFGWSFAALMASIAIQSGTVILVSPLAGAAVDRFSARTIALGSLVLFGLSYMSLALTPGSLWVFYGQWVLMSVVGAGTLPSTWTRAVNGWFDRNLGLALGLASSGTGLAGFLLKPYGAWLIQQVGWRGAFVGIGLLPIVVGVPVVAAFFREPARDRRPRAVPQVEAVAAPTVQEPSVGQSLRTPRFWIMVAAFLLISFALTAPTPNLENIMRSLAFDRAATARVAAGFGLSVIGGRLLGGWLLDRIWAPACALGFLLLPAAGCVALSQGRVSERTAVLAVVALGIAAGFEFDLLAFMSSRYFGRRHYGAIYGAFYAVIAAGGGLGPVVFGRAFDVTGTYAQVLRIGAGCMIAGGVLLLAMGRYPVWPRAETATPQEAV